MLGNTYHLMLRPGAERIARLGGLHRFMDWPGPILTDSGGFQVMSLAELRKLDADGVTFRSHLDGAAHRLTPARDRDPAHAGRHHHHGARRVHAVPGHRGRGARVDGTVMRWARASRAGVRARPGYALFGIVQGSVFPACAPRSRRACHLGFEGYAIGGLAVGEGQVTTFAVLDATVPPCRRTRRAT